MSVLPCCRYRVAIWVCLAIAEQHKPGPCNSRSNRQCNLLIHPSLVFVLKCLSFYPLRLDSTSTLEFSLSLELFHVPSPPHMCSVVLLRLCSHSCLAVSVLIYFLASKHITWVRSSSVYTSSVWARFSCFFLQKVVFLESWRVCSQPFFYKWMFEYGY